MGGCSTYEELMKLELDYDIFQIVAEEKFKHPVITKNLRKLLRHTNNNHNIPQHTNNNHKIPRRTMNNH